MKKIDFRHIDDQLLCTFLLLLEESSVTKTAERLGVTQSSVSHALGRLRLFLDDPLFIRSGQAMLPTERALSLKEPVQAVLDGLQGLTHQREFNPLNDKLFFIVAANDMQRELIFPTLLLELREEGIHAAFEFIPSGHPTPGMMRDARCHLALTPFPADATDIIQKPLLKGTMMCFFDGTVREAPATWVDYCRSDHLTVRFPDGGTSLRALTGVDKSKIRDAQISVPNFGAIPSFIKGSQLIATEMDLMKLCTLSDLDMAPLPKKSDPVSVYMSWHSRSTNEPSHKWLRGRVDRIAEKIMAVDKTS